MKGNPGAADIQSRSCGVGAHSFMAPPECDPNGITLVYSCSLLSLSKIISMHTVCMWKFMQLLPPRARRFRGGGGGRELDANPPTPAAPAAPGIYTLLGKAAARAAGGAAADIIVACAVCLVMKCIYNKWI